MEANEKSFVVNGQTNLKCFRGQTVSLIPIFTAVKGVTTKGLKWEINNKTMDKNFMSLSNICLSDNIFISIIEAY